MNLYDRDPSTSLKVRAEIEFSVYEIKFTYWVPSECIKREKLKRLDERTRRDGLWKGNCLELFWSGEDSSYWEMNLSFSGDWQIYFFKEYRGKAEEEQRIRMEGLRQEFEGEFMRIQGSLVSPKLRFDDTRSFNPTVILEVSGEQRFFASRHGAKPDFHRQNLWLKNSK